MYDTNSGNGSGRLLSTHHACRYVDVSRATLFRAARRGDLRPVHLGEHFIRWRVTELDAWANRGAAAPA